MKIVVDVNELFSLLIKGTSKSEAILFSENVEIIAPQFLLIEFSKHKQEIIDKTHRSEEDLNKLLFVFKRRIKIVPKNEFE